MVTGWNHYLDKLYAEQSKLYADVQAARALGMKNSDIYRHLTQKAKIGKAEAQSIMRGKFSPTPVSKDVYTDVRRELNEGVPSRAGKSIPWGLFNRLTAQSRGRDLDPKILEKQKAAAAAAKAAPPQPVAQAPSPPQPIPQPQPIPRSAASPTPVPAAPSGGVTQAASGPPPTAPSVRAVQQAAIDPKILGGSYADQLANRTLPGVRGA